MESHRTKASRRLLRDIKDEAKASARTGAEVHSHALERLALEHGYDSWNELHRACESQPASPAPTSPAGLPIDPPLRRMFDQTSNEDRSEWEIERWWGKPFIVTMEGRYDVRCLDGGAWDRSSWYGSAQTLEECDRIAAAKLARWQEFQRQPYTQMMESGKVRVVRLAWRPGVEPEVLFESENPRDASEFIKNYGERAAPKSP